MKENIQNIPVEIIPLEENSWGAAIGASRLLLSSAIDSQKKAEALIQKAEKLNRDPPLRMGACQLSDPIKEWELISTEHFWMTWIGWHYGLSGQNAHMTLPLEPLYVPKEERPPSEFLLKDMRKLIELQNIDGWETYCFWLSEDAERILEHIPLEALDSYTLEADLKSFLHEVRAAMLRYEEFETAENVLRVGVQKKLLALPLTLNEDAVSYEKLIIRARSDARGRLKIQAQVLADCARVIGAIDETHPELISFEMRALLLSHLLEQENPSFGGQFLPLQLLNDELGIVSCLHDDQGLDRAFFVFAIQIALAVLQQTVPRKELVGLALAWESMPYPGPPLAETLRRTVLEALEKISIPLMRTQAEVQKSFWHEGYRENREFLKFLPAKGNVQNKEGKWVEANLLHLDDKTHAPVELAPAGHYLITKLFPKE